MNITNLFRLKGRQKTGVRLVGSLMGYWIRPDGARVPWWRIPVHNIIPNVALAQIALLYGDAAGVPFLYGAVGTGTNDPAITDTQLQTEVSRVAGSFSRIQTAVANDTAQLVSEHTAPAGGWNLTEYATVNAATVGTIGCRIKFTAVNVAEGNKFQMTYQCQVQRV